MEQNNIINLTNNIIIGFGENSVILINCFRILSNIALDSEDSRELCLEKNCVNIISDIIKYSKDLAVNTEGKITIENILKKKNNEIQDKPLKSLKKNDELITKEMKNFLIEGKICKL